MRRKGQQNKKKDRKGRREEKLDRYNDVEQLQARIQAEAPPPHVYYYKVTEADAENVSGGTANTSTSGEKKKMPIQFGDLPISQHTKRGLQLAKFEVMTDVQRCVIPHALKGRDILACARTGSGKTLAFLVPLLETLYRERWTNLDGLGALVLVPTRELALQVFNVLKGIGKQHTFSAGSVIGGNQGVSEEKLRIGRLNILIGTPGRVLQHMNETPNFSCDNLRLLVLDEVDRILDLGFAEDMDQILSNIPRITQIILTSATLSLKIQRLAKLNLKSPEYISIHNYEQGAETSEGTSSQEPRVKPKITPSGLLEHYVVVEAKDKVDMVFSFLRSHLRSKILFFVSCCKEVRYYYEVFRKLRPGISLYELYGRLKQAKRTAIFTQYAKNPRACALFATDVASRGLDLPAVDWVVQIDCPEDVDAYIHRVGRTARHKATGNSLLFLLPSELHFVSLLEQKGITMKQISINPHKTVTVEGKIRALLSEDAELMHLAQKAFAGYVRTVHLMSNKQVFNVAAIDPKSFAESLGLATTPVVNIVSVGVTTDIASPQAPAQLTSQSQSQSPSKSKSKSKLSKLKEKLALKKRAQLKPPADDAELFTVARKVEPGDIDEIVDKASGTRSGLEPERESESESVPAPVSLPPSKPRKIRIGKAIGNTRIRFDAEGKAITFEEAKEDPGDDEQEQRHLEAIRSKLQQRDKAIKETWKEKIARQKREQRHKRKLREAEKSGQSLPVYLQEPGDDVPPLEESERNNRQEQSPADEEGSEPSRSHKRKKVAPIDAGDNIEVNKLEDQVLQLLSPA